MYPFESPAMNAQLHPCLVIPITFRPYVETGEFACFGVLVHCPETGYVGYRIGEKDRRVTERINNFFKEIGRDIFRMTVKSAKLDLEQVVNAPSSLFDYQQAKTLLENLIRPRENLIRYGAPIAVMTENPAVEVDRQYALLVQRGFVDRAGIYENDVRTRVKKYLAERRIQFRQFSFRAPNNYVFNLPIAFDGRNGTKAIKALNLVGNSVTETFDNGLKWLYRFEQLLQNGFKKDNLLVPVNLVENNPENRKAVIDVYGRLTKIVPTVDSSDFNQEHESLVRFTEDAVSA